ncbi:hypothetical protein JMA_09770 [Jeotgalibacillus malaysiensis]|uniref:Uncharacterized protein n=1 Tax=Jeotgalibacillus malaysiensis TaxID=1508404 RepID=A0A0B5AQD3_9BACL|nr:hypothetical protein JMA_09770 [Jeotgalibacillus malaysiensis]
MLSFLKDSHEAQTDEKKFKQMLLQMIFGIIFAVSLFAMIFWWIS